MPKRAIRLTCLLIIAALLLAACSSAGKATPTPSGAPARQAATAQAGDSSQPPANPYPASGNPPAGAPPSGNPADSGEQGLPPQGVAPQGGGAYPPPDSGSGAPSGAPSADSGLSSATGVYTLDGKTDTQAGQTYTASDQDQSGVYVLNGGSLTLNNATVTTHGNTSSADNSSFYGLNVGVLAASGSTITMNGGTITTSGSGANGAFATGSQTVVTLSNVTIQAGGDGGHGVMATQGGAMTLTDVTMNTTGPHAAPVATDRGGGTITVNGGQVVSSGQDSPCYYSTGVLTIDQNICQANGSEAAVIEGANSIILTGSTLTTTVADKWGVLIYQSFSGDALGSDGIFSMAGGSLISTAASSPLFYVTNTDGHVTLQGVTVSVASGILLQAEGNDRWGASGANGGTVQFIADGQTLNGDLVADKLSTINLTLQNNSTLSGAINAANSAKAVNLVLDAGSAWNVTANSYISCLTDPAIAGTAISNINGNGHTVYYDPAACAELGGQTYTLNGGGTLTPVK